MHVNFYVKGTGRWLSIYHKLDDKKRNIMIVARNQLSQWCK